MAEITKLAVFMFSFVQQLSIIICLLGACLGVFPYLVNTNPVYINHFYTNFVNTSSVNTNSVYSNSVKTKPLHTNSVYTNSVYTNSVYTNSVYTNPVVDANFPDPGVLALQGKGYAVVVSSGEEPDAFPLAYSLDLVQWEHMGHIFPAGSWPVWAATNMWAPEIHLVNGRYLCYFSASHANGRHSIGVAVSESGSPWGPYRDLGYPLVFHNEDSVVGLIDPSYFHDPETGKHYALWKGDTWAPIRISAIYIQELEEDGLSFLPGSKPEILLQDDQQEELLIVEGPWLMYRQGKYYLFYSSSWVQLPSYHIGVARASSVVGPYTKRDIPVLQNDWDRPEWYNNGENSTYEGPGHGSVVCDSAGAWWLVYASWKYGHLDREPGRVMLLDRVTWSGAPSLDWWPYIGVPSDTPQEAPAVGVYNNTLEGDNIDIF